MCFFPPRSIARDSKECTYVTEWVINTDKQFELYTQIKCMNLYDINNYYSVLSNIVQRFAQSNQHMD